MPLVLTESSFLSSEPRLDLFVGDRLLPWRAFRYSRIPKWNDDVAFWIGVAMVPVNVLYIRSLRGIDERGMRLRYEAHR